MFSNREARIRFVKDKKNAESSPSSEDRILHPNAVKLIAERSREVVKFTAITVIGAYAAIKTIDTVSQVIIKKTRSADQD